ncbi:MAG: hypothetical protein KA792_08905, partial [Bacteroidales bacterium]|nr:hypothetical protein [Bacteroidales bacterium]
MNLKQYIFFIFILFNNFCVAQLEFANYEEYQQLLKSKTLVVEYDYIFSSFNDVMKEAMPKFW